MSKTLRTLGLAALLAVSASAMMSSQASALSMSECSAKYRAAKAAGTDGGMKWNDFRKANCAADAAATTAAAPVAPAAKPAKAAKMAPAAPAATAAAVTPSGSFMQQCSAAWKAMGAANTRPAGMKWKDFVASKCVVPGGAAAAAPAAPAAPAAAATAPAMKVAPAEPTGAADNTPAPTVDKNGKPLSAKQVAARVRIKQCGNMWRADKAANKLAAGATWPAYWHDCSMKLKAAGQ